MRAHSVRTVLVLLLAVGAGGCAAMTQGSSTRVSGDVITSEHLEGMGNRTVAEALIQLKPIWVRSQRYANMRVYLDGIQQGGRSVLSRIQVQNVERIEFMDGRQATMEFGIGHGGGALLISTQG